MDSKYGRLFTEADVRELLCDVVDVAETERMLDGFVGTLPADEPQFVLRAQDENAVLALRSYRNYAYTRGASDRFQESLRDTTLAFQQWANDHGTKTPD